MKQQEDNYTKTPNYLFFLINDIDLAETRLLLQTLRRTVGFHRNEWETSINGITYATNLSRPSIYRALGNLTDKQYISTKKKGQQLVIQFDPKACEKVVQNVLISCGLKK